MSVKGRFASTVAAVVVAVSVAIGAAAPANAATVNPVAWTLRKPARTEDSNFVKAFATNLFHPGKDPLGANDWSCKPGADHPEPVVLIHGTWETAYDNWNGLSPILKAQGYCVFALDYGNTTGLPQINGTGDMVASADEIAAYVQKVQAATGASKVALIGHSQGGTQARYVANLLLPGVVDTVIMLAPSSHLTTLLGFYTLVRLSSAASSLLNAIGMPAAVQQAHGDGPFYVSLNGAGETRPGINYTVIATRADEIATPYTAAFITAGPGATVDNITIQSVCPLDLSEHLSLSYSKNVAQIILNKLDPAHPHKIKCSLQAPLVGGTA
ncbi:MAG: alpha/beta fold hydrolase [Propionibacteriaceae bacterium]|jgi:triacylglycerol esterase/lipase EstA (alpha/beta hydrolase family)|nr:alpha/beta fold hydrolase [Propionibacteriaceae bacterium]